MAVFICTDHKGHYPVGVASVVIAEDVVKARELLYAELAKRGLHSDDFTLMRLDRPGAYILRDGDY